MAAVQTAAVPGPGSTTIARLRLRGLKVATIVVFAVVFGWVWKSALFPPTRPAPPQNALGNAPAPAREAGEGHDTIRRLETSPGAYRREPVRGYLATTQADNSGSAPQAGGGSPTAEEDPQILSGAP